MKLTPWKPFAPVEDLFTNDDWLIPVFSRESALNPAIDIYETSDAVIAEANIPDFSPENISVEVEDGYLTLSGTVDEKKEEEDKKKGYWRHEIRKGSFMRTVSLPKNIDENSATAHYEHGVLKVTIAKISDAAKKKVKVKVS